MPLRTQSLFGRTLLGALVCVCFVSQQLRTPLHLALEDHGCVSSEAERALQAAAHERAHADHAGYEEEPDHGHGHGHEEQGLATSDEPHPLGDHFEDFGHPLFHSTSLSFELVAVPFEARQVIDFLPLLEQLCCERKAPRAPPPRTAAAPRAPPVYA